MNGFRKTILILAVCAATTLTACSASSPSSVVQAYMKAAAAGDSDAMMSLYYFKTMDAHEVALDKKKLKVAVSMQHRMIQSHGGLESVDVTHLKQTDETHATAQFLIHFVDGRQKQGHLKLIKVDNQWRVSPQ